MKLKFAFLAGAAALAVAGQASAAITLGNAQGGSSLFLSVWDNTTNESYTRNLGTNLNGFLPNSITTLPNDGNVAGTPVTGDKTPELGLNLSFAGDALFTSTFADNTASNIQWNIVAYDNQASAATGLSRFVSTANGAPQTINGGVGGVGSGATNYLNALVAGTQLGGAANSVVVTDPTVQSFAGNPNWGDGLNNGLNGSSSGTGFGGELDFYYIARTVASGQNSATATNVQFGNSSGNAKWTLAANGTATYTLAGNVTEVPVPAAAWLLASGLVVGLKSARRRKAAAKAA